MILVPTVLRGKAVFDAPRRPPRLHGGSGRRGRRASRRHPHAERENESLAACISFRTLNKGCGATRAPSWPYGGRGPPRGAARSLLLNPRKTGRALPCDAPAVTIARRARTASKHRD